MRKQILSVAIALPMVMGSTASTFASEVVKVSQLTTFDVPSPQVLPNYIRSIGAKRPLCPKGSDPKQCENPSPMRFEPIRFDGTLPIKGNPPLTNMIEQPTRKRPPLHRDSVILQQK